MNKKQMHIKPTFQTSFLKPHSILQWNAYQALKPFPPPRPPVPRPTKKSINSQGMIGNRSVQVLICGEQALVSHAPIGEAQQHWGKDSHAVHWRPG